MSKFEELTKDLFKDLKEKVDKIAEIEISRKNLVKDIKGVKNKIIKISVKHLDSVTKDLKDLLYDGELKEEYQENYIEPLYIEIAKYDLQDYHLQIFGEGFEQFEDFAKKSTRKYSIKEIKLGQSLMDQINEIIHSDLDSELIEDILSKSFIPTYN